MTILSIVCFGQRIRRTFIKYVILTFFLFSELTYKKTKKIQQPLNIIIVIINLAT